ERGDQLTELDVSHRRVRGPQVHQIGVGAEYVGGLEIGPEQRYPAVGIRVRRAVAGRDGIPQSYVPGVECERRAPRPGDEEYGNHHYDGKGATEPRWRHACPPLRLRQLLARPPAGSS